MNEFKQISIDKIRKIGDLFSFEIDFPAWHNIVLFLSLLFLVSILVFETKIVLILLVGAVLITTVLLKPAYIYLLFISLFSIEGFTVFEGVSYPKIVGLLLMIGLTLKLALKKDSIPKDSSYKYFFLFFIGSVVSFAFAKNLTVSFQIYITYISLFILYIFTRYFLKNMEDVHNALNAIFFSTILVFAIVQIMNLSVRHRFDSRISSGMGDPNEFASYILVLIPLVLYRAIHSFGIRKIIFWGVLIIYILLLVATGSRGGVLGFLGASAVLIYYYGIGKMRQIVIFLILVATIAIFFIPDEFWFRVTTITNPETERGHAISLRIGHYKAAVKMILDYPIAGVGLANFKFNNMNYGDTEQQVVHNTYLEILTGGGLLSFIPFMLILLSCWSKLNIKMKVDKNIVDILISLKASFVSILITSFFLSADHKKILWFLLALISSVFYIASEQNKKRDISLR
ncbi:MAG: hypothetical protein A2X59_07735 [Nitrospirae bacterium GWC2_42_7]|nr:MAG: hypothetical protein A2X59_07735 [Nitrospirae bacterium GWC2_42_7]